MKSWLNLRQSPNTEPESVAPTDDNRRLPAVGKYRLLYKYLHDRYADTVVLTFAQIEDLLGFSLPDLARRSEGWWTAPEPATGEPRCSDSWTLARRTARPNLTALTVVFERIS